MKSKTNGNRANSTTAALTKNDVDLATRAGAERLLRSCKDNNHLGPISQMLREALLGALAREDALLDQTAHSKALSAAQKMCEGMDKMKSPLPRVAAKGLENLLCARSEFKRELGSLGVRKRTRNIK